MCAIFVSHSKYDKEMMDFFTSITSRLGIKNFFMEWEDLEGKYPAKRITEIIRSRWIENVTMVVVLLGPNLSNPPNQHFTHNWVTFEVGVASGCGKPVLVLEEINHITNFPIPYLTDYYQYQLDSKEDRIQIGETMKTIRLISTGNKRVPKNISTKCGHSDCNAVFNLWMRYSNEINCPACRRPIIIQSE